VATTEVANTLVRIFKPPEEEMACLTGRSSRLPLRVSSTFDPVYLLRGQSQGALAAALADSQDFDFEPAQQWDGDW
jgi:hypothetical protein